MCLYNHVWLNFECSIYTKNYDELKIILLCSKDILQIYSTLYAWLLHNICNSLVGIHADVH